MTENSGSTRRSALIVLGCVVIALFGAGLYLFLYDLPRRAERASSVPTQTSPENRLSMTSAEEDHATALAKPEEPTPSSDASEPSETTAQPGAEEEDTAGQSRDDAATQTADPAEAVTSDSVTSAPGETEPAVTAPSIDVVRVEPDGSALIAGTGHPGSEVTFLLDGTETGRASIDAAGKFAAFLTLEILNGPRVLSLLSRAEGQEIASEDQIILAPSLPVETESTAPQEDLIAEASAPREQPQNGTGANPVEATAEDMPAQQPEQVTAANPSESASLEPAVRQGDEDSPVQAQGDPADTPETTAPNVVASVDPGLSAAAAEPPSPSLSTGPASSRPAKRSVESLAIGPAVSAAAQGIEQAPAPTPVPAAAPIPSAAPEIDAPVERTATSDAAPVTSTNTIAVLRASRNGVELIQPSTSPAPQAMDQIALDTISYSDAGEVQLSGRARNGSFVRVYLDNRGVAEIDTDPQGQWRGELQDVVPGVYTLRLDELGEDGTVLSRVETPFKREAPSLLVAPVAEAGAENGAAIIRAVTVQQGDTLWAISQERYGEGLLYVRVFEANRNAIRDPDLIYPGQVFTIPD